MVSTAKQLENGLTMKKALYLGASMLAVAAASTVSASAADMYGAAGGYKDGPVYSNTWTGFYLGGHLGAAWGTDKTVDLDDFITQGMKTSNNTNASGVYGLQTGYNWQLGNVVVGVEADLGSMDLNHSTTDRFGDTIQSLNSGIYGDLTGRLGYSLGQ